MIYDGCHWYHRRLRCCLHHYQRYTHLRSYCIAVGLVIKTSITVVIVVSIAVVVAVAIVVAMISIAVAVVVARKLYTMNEK